VGAAVSESRASFGSNCSPHCPPSTAPGRIPLADPTRSGVESPRGIEPGPARYEAVAPRPLRCLPARTVVAPDALSALAG